MGAPNVIVRGKGEPLAFCSSAHGAGRLMSRGQARRTFTVGDLTAAMQGTVWLEREARHLLDEAPGAYKDVNQVLRDQKDLAEVEVVLNQLVNYKGA